MSATYLSPASYVLAAALCLSHTPVLADPAGTAASLHEYADWSVACDNNRRCEAVGVSRQRAHARQSEWGEHGLAVLRIIREAQPEAPLQVFLDERLWGGEPTDRHAELTLHVLYPDQGDRTGPPFRLLPLLGGQYELDPRDVTALVAESAASTTIATRLGAINALGSTDGMGQALRHMEQVQNETALPPPPPRQPLVSARHDLAGLLVEDDELRRRGMIFCGVVAAPHQGQRFRLDNGDTLWSVDCGEEHAITAAEFALNPRTRWFIVRAGGTRVFEPFPLPGTSPPTSATDLPNSAFDPASGILTATHYGALDRDCGWRRQWGWDGRTWQLVAAWELHGCMGVMAEGWLPVWQTVAR